MIDAGVLGSRSTRPQPSRTDVTVPCRWAREVARWTTGETCRTLRLRHSVLGILLVSTPRPRLGPSGQEMVRHNRIRWLLASAVVAMVLPSRGWDLLEGQAYPKGKDVRTGGPAPTGSRWRRLRLADRAPDRRAATDRGALKPGVTAAWTSALPPGGNEQAGMDTALPGR